MALGYLPYFEEKSWDETMLSPTQLIGMERIEGLPTYSMAYNIMRGNTKNSRDLPAVARYFYGVPGALGGMLVDGVGQIGNAALNGYKRLYNDGAALYNNVAAQLNSIGNTPQTRLTGRVMPRTERVTKYAAQPVTYLGPSAAPITVDATAAEPVSYLGADQVADINAQTLARTKIVNALGKMANSGSLTSKDGAAKARALIDLYKKLK